MPRKKKPGRKAKPGPKPVKHLWRRFYYKKLPRKNAPIVVNGRKSLLIRHGAEDTEVIKRVGFDRFRFMRWGGNLKRRTGQVRGEVIALVLEKRPLLEQEDVQVVVPRRLYDPLEVWLWRDGRKVYVRRKMNYYTFVWLLDLVEQMAWDNERKQQNKKDTK